MKSPPSLPNPGQHILRFIIILQTLFSTLPVFACVLQAERHRASCFFVGGLVDKSLVSNQQK